MGLGGRLVQHSIFSRRIIHLMQLEINPWANTGTGHQSFGVEQQQTQKYHQGSGCV